MSARHTPGPWIAFDHRDIDRGWWVGVNHPEWGEITHAEVRSGCDEADELGSMEANARLIAAAPELLDAVRELLPALAMCQPSSRHGSECQYRALQLGQRAISKATSRQTTDREDGK